MAYDPKYHTMETAEVNPNARSIGIEMPLQRDKGQIESLVGQIDDSLDRAFHQLDYVRTRVAPVLMESPSSDGEMAATPKPSMSPLGNTLDHHNDRIRELIRQLAEIGDRVDL